MRGGALLVRLALIPAACSISGRLFGQEDRLSCVAPDDRSEVTLPLTVRWEVEDFEVGEGAGSFAVFVDRAPQPPRKTLDWLAREHDGCRAADGCPDARWFAER